jgi:hypothetical protein
MPHAVTLPVIAIVCNEAQRRNAFPYLETSAALPSRDPSSTTMISALIERSAR